MAYNQRKRVMRIARRAEMNLRHASERLSEIGVNYDERTPDLAEKIGMIVTGIELMIDATSALAELLETT